jgi:hypothetical protein
MGWVSPQKTVIFAITAVRFWLLTLIGLEAARHEFVKLNWTLNVDFEGHGI